MDGIKITPCHFINTSQKRQNGFPSKVCHHFLLGFPYNWEEYTISCSDKDSSNRSVSTRVSTSNDSCLWLRRDGTLHFSLEDLLVTRIGDFLIPTFEELEHCFIKGSYSDQATSSSTARNIIEISVPRRALKVGHPIKLFSEDVGILEIFYESNKRSSRRQIILKSLKIIIISVLHKIILKKKLSEIQWDNFI